MKYSIIIIYFFCIIQGLGAKQDVASFLQKKTLSDFVASCDSSEETALQLLNDFDLPDKCSAFLMWYDETNLYLASRGYQEPHEYASLKQKANSWIIRIFWNDYDECGDKIYDFGYWDYRIDIKNINARSVIKNKNNEKGNLIKKEIEEWFILLRENGLDKLRQMKKPPVSYNEYVKRNLFKGVHEICDSKYQTGKDSIKCKFSKSTRQPNVEYYLMHKTLSQFVESCNSCEEDALQWLYKFSMPRNGSDSLMWYSNYDLGQLYNPNLQNDSCKVYASLKIKAYSWMIRIFWNDYDENCDLFYDFGFWDYEKRESENVCVKRKKTDKQTSIDRFLKSWIKLVSKDGVHVLRNRMIAPIHLHKYRVVANDN